MNDQVEFDLVGPHPTPAGAVQVVVAVVVEVAVVGVVKHKSSTVCALESPISIPRTTISRPSSNARDWSRLAAARLSSSRRLAAACLRGESLVPGAASEIASAGISIVSVRRAGYKRVVEISGTDATLDDGVDDDGAVWASAAEAVLARERYRAL